MAMHGGKVTTWPEYALQARQLWQHLRGANSERRTDLVKMCSKQKQRYPHLSHKLVWLPVQVLQKLQGMQKRAALTKKTAEWQTFACQCAAAPRRTLDCLSRELYRKQDVALRALCEFKKHGCYGTAARCSLPGGHVWQTRAQHLGCPWPLCRQCLQHFTKSQPFAILPPNRA